LGFFALCVSRTGGGLDGNQQGEIRHKLAGTSSVTPRALRSCWRNILRMDKKLQRKAAEGLSKKNQQP
jgi:hypothetical protein